MRNSLFIGRFQPLHEGHINIIEKVLKEGKPVCVALMDTIKSDKNPYSVEERKQMFAKVFGNKVKVISIPPIDEVCYGRNVGWGRRKIETTPEMEKISATNIRKKMT